MNAFNVTTKLNSTPVTATADLHIGEAVYKLNFAFEQGLKITGVSSRNGDVSITELLNAIATNSSDLYHLMVIAGCDQTNVSRYIAYMARASAEVKRVLQN